MNTVKESVPRFTIGHWVSFEYGLRRVWAQIIEDRGPLGVNGRWIYRVRVDDDPESGESDRFEVPEDDLAPGEPDKAAVIEALKRGGLLTILRYNLGGAPEKPRAWLTFDSRGNLVPTFDKYKGLIGGEVVPFFALQGYQIFTPKVDEVLNFLPSFGLSRAEAKEVVQSVGQVP